MTTIAYDGRILAADSQSERYGVRYRVHKIHRLSDGSLFAGSGSIQDVLAVLSWLEGGEKPTAIEDFDGIMITALGAERIGERLIRVRCLEPCHAIGSGAHFALAAMHCGKNAIDAVTLAIQLDVHSGGEIEFDSLGEIAK